MAEHSHVAARHPDIWEYDNMENCYHNNYNTDEDQLLYSDNDNMCNTLNSKHNEKYTDHN